MANVALTKEQKVCLYDLRIFLYHTEIGFDEERGHRRTFLILKKVHSVYVSLQSVERVC